MDSFDGSGNERDLDPLRSSLLANQPLIAAFFGFATAQCLAILTSWCRGKSWEVRKLLGPTCMPCSHAATVMALTAAIGLRDGPGGSLFAIALVFASVVMYDTAGVRLQAGHQAEVLNQIVVELPREHPLADSRPLRELLGHTLPQVVAGAVTGCLVAVMLHALNGLSQ